MAITATKPQRQLLAWRQWPRETRDTLFLLAVIAWVIAPHASHLPLWCSSMAAGVLLWRGWLALNSRPLPNAAWRVLLLALALAGTWWSHSTIAGRDGGVTLAVVLLSMKTLELRARRDAFVVFFFGFFIIITHFLFAQTLGLAVAMLLGLWGLLTAVVNAHMPAGRPPLRHSFKTAGWLMLLGAPIMLALFVLFPRFAPLWGLPQDQSLGKTGLSEQMEIGQVTALALDDSVALRLKFVGDAPPKSEMYFRGPVLGEFDGQSWRMSPIGRFSGPDTPLQAGVQALGPSYRYSVTQEPSYRPWLMALELPASLPTLAERPVWQSADMQLLMRRPASDLLRYEVQSHTRYHYGLDLPAWQQRQLAHLPPQSNPRTVAWVQGWKAQTLATQPELDAAALARRFSDFLQQKLHNEDYRYTLEPGPYGRHSADEFWFDTQAGFCEHIASSYVVAMRALGVPARVVTGFQGAEFNSLDGFWVVRNSDAHAWAEIWLPDQGWQRVDPTGAIAPWRIDLEQTRLRPRPSAIGGVFEAAVSPTLLARMRQVWDASNNAWNQWVLNYNQTRQMDVLKKLGFEQPNWHSLIQLLGGLLLLIALAGTAYNYWHKRQQDPWLALLAQAKARLQKAGMASTPSSSPRQLAAAVGQGQWQTWLLDLEAQRYAATGGHKAQLQALRQRLKRLPKLKPQ